MVASLAGRCSPVPPLATAGATVSCERARANDLRDHRVATLDASSLAKGVDARPYGTPSAYEADVVRRNVEWLTADPVSSINFTPLHKLEGIITPNGVCFERHHGGNGRGGSGEAPADDQRPRG